MSGSGYTADLTLRDRVKRLYQRFFGGGHHIADPAAAEAQLRAECDGLPRISLNEPLFEPIGGGHCRMNLRPLLRTGLSLETAAGLFIYSANHKHSDFAGFEAALEALAENEDEREWIADYLALNCPALSHSEAYRARYAPAYRVVLDVFADPGVFSLLQRLDTLGEGIVAIDGPCAAGKSTLAALLGGVFGASVLHIDDFFLRPEQRTPERLAEPGGNFDRERFLHEALEPMRRGEGAAFRPYDCATQTVGAPIWTERTPLVLVEGVYSLHPALRDAYALTVFCDISPEAQQARLLQRGEATLARFQREWIPLEAHYFQALGIPERCDIRLAMPEGEG